MPDYNGYGGVLKDLSFMGNRLPRWIFMWLK